MTLVEASDDWLQTYDDLPVSLELIEAIQAALPDQVIVEPRSPRKILVFSATAGFRHRSIPTGKMALERVGLATGAYSAVVSDDPAHFEVEALRGFDAVVLLNTTEDFFMPSSRQRPEFTDQEWAELQVRHERLVSHLVAYVHQGGGLVGIHSTTDSCYGHEGFGGMIGAYFDGHPWGHTSRVRIVVEDPEHAVNREAFGLVDSFVLVEEIYQFRQRPYSRENLRILLHLDPSRSDAVEGAKRKDHDYPVAWVQAFGQGRVFYTSIGHNHEVYTNPMVLRHYLAGIQFATGDLEADTTPSAALVEELAPE